MWERMSPCFTPEVSPVYFTTAECFDCRPTRTKPCWAGAAGLSSQSRALSLVQILRSHWLISWFFLCNKVPAQGISCLSLCLYCTRKGSIMGAVFRTTVSLTLKIFPENHWKYLEWSPLSGHSQLFPVRVRSSFNTELHNRFLCGQVASNNG